MRRFLLGTTAVLAIGAYGAASAGMVILLGYGVGVLIAYAVAVLA